MKNFKEGLPSKDRFYNTLTNQEISDKNHEHVLNVWEAFKMNTMKDYHDLHLKINVLSLTCVSETFRKKSINSFELGLAHYLSATGCSCDGMLRFTEVSLKLISGFEKYQFIKSTIRVVLP